MEAARWLKQKALSPGPAAVSAATSEAAEDPEDGELPEAPEEAASKRRKHSPIVWSGVPKRSAGKSGYITHMLLLHGAMCWHPEIMLVHLRTC